MGVEMRAPNAAQRRLAAILSADVAGYTGHMNRDEAGTLRLLTVHRQTAARVIAQHEGRIANTAGDSILAEFPSAVNALQCAIDIQERIASVNDELPATHRIVFRMGLHVGEVMVRDGDLFGDGVNIAARIQGQAQPGGILLSEDAHRFVHRTLPLSFDDIGPQHLKDVDIPIRIFAVHLTRAPGTGHSRALPSPHHRRTEPHLARRLHDLYDISLSAITETEGLTVLEYAFLSALWDCPGVDQPWLVQCFGQSPAKTTGILRLLESRGFIKRMSTDGRTALDLTLSGIEVRQRLRLLVVVELDRILAPLSEHERELLKDLLARIIQANEARLRQEQTPKKKPKAVVGPAN